MSRLPPETLPIWQRVIIIIMMSGRSGELWGLLSRGEKWNPSSITHRPSLQLSPVFKPGEEPRFVESPPPRQEASKAVPDWTAAAHL